MKNVHRFLTRVILVMATACTTISETTAAPTMEQVNRVTREVTIPMLRIEVARLKALRANPLTREMGSLWDELDRETDPTTGKAPLARVNNPKDNMDMAMATAWLRWRILSENADSRYSYAHAANVHRTSETSGIMKMEAVIYFFQGRLALRIDGARCVDQSSPEGIGLRYETDKSIQPLYAYIAALSKVEKALAMFTAAAIEEMRGERPPVGDLCVHGVRATLRALQSGRQFEPISPTDPRAPDSPGRNFEINVSGFEPEVIPDDEWRIKRREIIDSFIKAAIDQL